MNSIISEKKFIQSRLGIPYESLSQSYLSSQTALATQSTISFPLQQGKRVSPLITERLLQLNDQFVITHFTVGLKQIASDTPTTQQLLNATLQTWEDPVVFAGTNAVNVASIYNSSLSFTINRKEFLPQFPVRAFRRVPTTQSGSVIVATGGATATYGSNRGANGYDNGLYAFYPCEPTLIDGRQTLDIEVQLGSSVAFDDASNTIYCVFEARGYLIVNAKD